MARDFPATSDDKITVAQYAAINNLTTLSIGFWGKRDPETRDSYGRPFLKDGAFQAWSENTTPQVTFEAQRWATTTGRWSWTMTNSVWAHTLITYDYGSTSNDPVVYENGSTVAVGDEQAPAGSLGSESAELLIGNYTTGTDRPFEGDMAEFAVWNRTLTAGEVKTVYRLGPLRAANGLVLYVPLYGAASPEPNYVDGGNSGTVTDAPYRFHPPVAPSFALGTNYAVSLPGSTSTGAGQKAVGITDITITFST